jgi:hypothetical protein
MAVATRRTVDIGDLGTIRDRLHLLTEDRSRLRPSAFRTVTGFSPSEMARRLQVHRPRVYNEEIRLEKQLRKRIIELTWASDLAYDLLGGDGKKVGLWLRAPNSAFGGDAPVEVILRGDGRHVIEFLMQRSGSKAGAAF